MATRDCRIVRIGVFLLQYVIRVYGEKGIVNCERVNAQRERKRERKWLIWVCEEF